MQRTLYLVGFGYLAICGAVVLRHQTRRAQPPGQPTTSTAGFEGSASQWFAAMKPFCNAVEVEIVHSRHPAPATLEGQGVSAACYALAGKIDSARAIIDRLAETDRYRAAGIVFDIAHPVADAGDNRSAGPIMELVISYWPNHYMALYHAGMAEIALGRSDLAVKNLTAFLSYYHENDGWTQSARETLARLAGGAEQ
jgi:tetratricopeptide (TPR) repeat protein